MSNAGYRVWCCDILRRKVRWKLPHSRRSCERRVLISRNAPISRDPHYSLVRYFHVATCVFAGCDQHVRIYTEYLTHVESSRGEYKKIRPLTTTRRTRRLAPVPGHVVIRALSDASLLLHTCIAAGVMNNTTAPTQAYNMVYVV